MFTNTVQNKSLVTFEEKMNIAVDNGIEIKYNEKLNIVEVYKDFWGDKRITGFIEVGNFKESKSGFEKQKAIRIAWNEALRVFAGHLYEDKNALPLMIQNTYSFLSTILYSLKWGNPNTEHILNAISSYVLDPETRSHPMIANLLNQIKPLLIENSEKEKLQKQKEEEENYRQSIIISINAKFKNLSLEKLEQLNSTLNQG